MSEVFIASNGVRLTKNSHGIPVRVHFDAGHEYEGAPGAFVMGSPMGVAVGEFYQHLRDQELGRWRWPENPQYVVYEDKARCYINQPAVIVFNENDGASAMCGRDGLYSASGIGALDKWCEPAAAAYFAAHQLPKPWHDAEPGEVWVLEWSSSGLTLGQPALVRNDGKFALRDSSSINEGVEPTDKRIVGAERVYPYRNASELARERQRDGSPQPRLSEHP